MIALKICEEIGFKEGSASALSNIGIVYAKQANIRKHMKIYPLL